MIERSQDSYDLKAMLAPGLILALPLLVDAVYAAPNLSGWLLFAAGGTCSLGLIYGFGRFARARGNAIEPELWRQWGGQPATRLLRHHDSHFGDDVKEAVRNALAKEFSVKLPNPNEEAINADRATRQLWTLTKKCDTTCASTTPMDFGTSTMLNMVSAATCLDAGRHGLWSRWRQQFLPQRMP